jgi:RNA polymerase sigma-70 factor (ECF subfamily)
MGELSAASTAQAKAGDRLQKPCRVPGDHNSDPQLIAAAQAGSPQAVTALVERYWDDAHRAAFLLVRDRHVAEDIAQEAMLAAVDAIDRFDRRRRFGPWLHRVVVNRAVDWLRANARRPETNVAEVHAEEPHADLIKPELSAEMAVALSSLEPEDRALIVLRHLFGYRSREIGRLISTRPATVRTRLRRALMQLQVAYERENEMHQGGRDGVERQ